MTSTVAALPEATPPVQPELRKSGSGNGSSFAGLIARAFSSKGQVSFGNDNPGNQRTARNNPLTSGNTRQASVSEGAKSTDDPDASKSASSNKPAGNPAVTIDQTRFSENEAGQMVPSQNGSNPPEHAIFIMLSSQAQASTQSSATDQAPS